MERRSVLEQVVRHFLCTQFIFKNLYQTPPPQHLDVCLQTSVPLRARSSVVCLRSSSSLMALNPVSSQDACGGGYRFGWSIVMDHHYSRAHSSRIGITRGTIFPFRSHRTTAVCPSAAVRSSRCGHYAPAPLHLQQRFHASMGHLHARHLETNSACGDPQGVGPPFRLNGKEHKKDAGSVAGVFSVGKVTVGDGQSLLKQLLERRAGLPVPVWASKAKAWRLGGNGSPTVGLGHPTEKGNGGTKVEPSLRIRREAQCEYVPLLHRPEFRNTAGERQQGNAAWAVLKNFKRSPSGKFDSQGESMVGTVEESDLTPHLPETTHGDANESDVEGNSGGCENSGWVTASGRSATRRLISDPVDWLAQAADCPPMNFESLCTFTGLTAQELHSPSRVSGSAHANQDSRDADYENSDSATAANARPARGSDALLKYAKAIKNDVRDALANHALRGIEPAGEYKGSSVKNSTTTVDNSSGHSDYAAKNDEGRLVFNIFTRRVVKQTSTSVRALSLIGIAVDDAKHELFVKDVSALHNMAIAMRQRRVSWPEAWSRGTLYAQVKYILLDKRVEDPAAKVGDLLRAQYQRLRGRQNTVVAVPASGSGDNVGKELAGQPTASHPAEATHWKNDERLLSMGDLNEEQQQVIHFALRGYHTYIGGGAGTGKSALLHVLKHQLRGEGLRVAVTATTGVASSHIGGCTLHHCFGINMHGDFTRPAELVTYDVIIIDEVSMLPRELFETLEWQLRRVNGVSLPFGGVQMILCGDFMQLGAIAAEPILNSPVFRSNFAMLKLTRMIRQSENPLFALQLQVLRRGRVPPGLESTVQFLSTKQIVEEKLLMEQLRQRQRAQLQAVVTDTTFVQAQGIVPPEPQLRLLDETAVGSDEGEEGKSGTQVTVSSCADNLGSATSMLSAGGLHVRPPLVHYVEDAVNLLPTNKQVQETNLQELAKLSGEVVVYNAQLLSPALLGTWSPTYLLHIKGQGRLNVKKVTLEIELYIGTFFNKVKEWSWWWTRMLGQQNIVLYHLFADALALRVRIPHGFDGSAALLTHMDGLADYLSTAASPEFGVQVREIILNAEGLHTEEDEFILEQYAARSPMNASLPLKVGARVMLRANLAKGLVNGSVGTVVGFRELHPDQLSRYLVGSAQREDTVHEYMNFLRYEHGFPVPLLPEVDFGNGRVEVILPVSHLVGGLSNTHHYSLSIVALPLTLAYAFTVHKVQGLTLVGRVHLELSRMWPCEHLLYVAMSRVRNPDQLSISSFDERLVCAGADCLLFDDSLPPVERVKVLPHFIQATWYRAPNLRKRLLRKKELERVKQKRKQKEKERLCKDAEKIIFELGSAAEA